MAQLQDGFSFTGRLGDVTAYVMHGNKKVILRSKGGPSKAKIKKSPEFALTRKNNSEWAGCTQAAQAFRMAILTVKYLADYNISGPLNGIAKMAQKLDLDGVLGERGIYFSQFKALFEGFNLNRNRLFDTVVRVSIIAAIDRKTTSATVTIPALWPTIQLDNAYNYPVYRFVVSLGGVVDVGFNEQAKKYKALDEQTQYVCCKYYSDWKDTKQPKEAEQISLRFDSVKPITANVSLVLAIGIEFGSQQTDTSVVPVKYSGSAKVVQIV